MDLFNDIGIEHVITGLQTLGFVAVTVVIAWLRVKLLSMMQANNVKDGTIQEQDRVLSAENALTHISINSQINLMNVLQCVVQSSKMVNKEKIEMIEILKESKEGLKSFLVVFDKIYEEYKGKLPSAVVSDADNILKDANTLVKDTFDKYEDLLNKQCKESTSV